MAGRPAKPADRRQRRNKRPELVSHEGGGVKVYPAPRGLLAKTTRDWDEFWLSPLSKSVLPTDVPALERLFQLRDDRERAHRGVRNHPMIEGSQGQAVMNPLHRQITSYDAEIRQLEDRFGLNTKARQQMGHTLAQAALTLDDLNAQMLADEADEPDPRIVRSRTARPSEVGDHGARFEGAPAAASQHGPHRLPVDPREPRPRRGRLLRPAVRPDRRPGAVPVRLRTSSAPTATGATPAAYSAGPRDTARASSARPLAASSSSARGRRTARSSRSPRPASSRRTSSSARAA